jgi:hypothetical protein
MDISEMLRQYEERLFDSSVRKNAEIVSSMLADEFQEFGSSGRIYSKPQILASLRSEPPIEFSLRDFKARLLADEIALVTYVSIRVEHGSPAREALRSSIWAVQDGQWKVLFHQGTRMSNQGVESSAIQLRE